MSMDWKKCLNNREEINSVELNPSKLIDSICHRLLLAKLKAYCFSSSALRLVSVFFVGRRQIVSNLNTRRSWYHGRQPEVFLQHDSHCACQDVLELRSRTSKREFSGWNQRFKFWVLRRVFVIQKRKFFVWNHVFFVRKKQNFTQIFERHFQMNYSDGVRNGFTLVCLMIRIWRVNRVPDPVLRGQPCRPWIKNVWCLSSLISIRNTFYLKVLVSWCASGVSFGPLLFNFFY